ncbi:hypothetical protein FKP32DRAFT_1598107 [Trametes sanguinea]|nr:hypothetical protein FKP32DRAFT_1598107 [Trametes sanguinea]
MALALRRCPVRAARTDAPTTPSAHNDTNTRRETCNVGGRPDPRRATTTRGGLLQRPSRRAHHTTSGPVILRQPCSPEGSGAC